MTEPLRTAVLLMAGAFACYTAGVWGARLAGRVAPWNLGLFWLGCACDGAGTERMRSLAGGVGPTFHGVTGALALALMLGHAAWATAVVLRRDERAARTFHRISVAVWSAWLVPFLSGMLLA